MLGFGGSSFKVHETGTGIRGTTAGLCDHWGKIDLQSRYVETIVQETDRGPP